MKYFKLFTIILLIGLLICTSSFAGVPQNRWAYQTSSGIPNLYTPLFSPNMDARVGSSWNEPRGSNTGATGPHTGVDQSVDTGSDVGPMFSPARILRNELSATGAQVIRYYNSATNKTFYSVYFIFLHMLWQRIPHLQLVMLPQKAVKQELSIHIFTLNY